MKNDNDKTFKKCSLPEGMLTPLEVIEQKRHRQAHFSHLLNETRAIVQSLDALSEIAETLSLDQQELETMTAKALATLANEMEEHFGISA